MHKIFADFNNTDEKRRIRLTNSGTLNDLKKYSIQLESGMEVLLNDEEEFSITGIVEFSDEEKIWVAKIDWDKLKSNNTE